MSFISFPSFPFWTSLLSRIPYRKFRAEMSFWEFDTITSFFFSSGGIKKKRNDRERKATSTTGGLELDFFFFFLYKEKK